MSEVYVAIEREDGTVAHLAFQTDGRFGRLPNGVGWAQFSGPDENGFRLWGRPATDAAIQEEVDRESRRVYEAAQRRLATLVERGVSPLPTLLELDGARAVSWKRLSADEHEKFNEHRYHRDALEMVKGEIRHNMPKARELHRHLLRHQRAEKLLVLDANYNGAVAAAETDRAAAIEVMRQELRDLTDDPRIEAAQTIDELVQVGFTEDGESALDALRAELKTMGRA